MNTTETKGVDMLNKIQNWLMNVAGLCFAVAKYMPKTVQLPYKVVKREQAEERKWWN